MKKNKKKIIFSIIGLLFVGILFFYSKNVKASDVVACPTGAPSTRVCLTPPAGAPDNWTTLSSTIKKTDGTVVAVDYWNFLPNSVTADAYCSGATGTDQLDCLNNGGNWIPAVTTIVSYYGNCKIPNTTLADGTIVDFCKSVPIANFANGIPSCGSDNTTINCVKSLGSAYTSKIEEYKQSVIDKMVSNSNLNSDKVNSAISDCAGDLACISKVINGMSGDSSFSQASSTSITADGPLTASSLTNIINSNSKTDTTGATNSASNDPSGLQGKMAGPAVQVTFTASGSGQSSSKMTANAIPSFFNDSSDPKKLYFTWYLKRKDCELTDPDRNNPNKKETDSAILSKCDLDGDARITENDWKIAAAKIIVKGGFDNTGVDYSKFTDAAGIKIDENTSGFFAVPAINEKKGDNNVGWRAGQIKKDNGDFYEDNGNSDDVRNCYVNAEKSGFSYELRTTTDISNFNSASECPAGYHRACVADQVAKCPIAGATPSTQDFKACAIYNEGKDSGNSNSDVYCSIKDDAALKDFKATAACKSQKDVNGNDVKAYPLCVKNDTTTPEKGINSIFKDSSQNVLGVVVGKIGDQNSNMCSAVATPDLKNENMFLKDPPLITADKETCSVVQDELINGTKTSSGAVDIQGNPNLNPKCEFTKGLNVCKHLFPNFPKKEVKLSDGSTVNLSDAVTGDGKFTLAEKHFWGTDPSKASTDGTGTDEQKVVGLGVDTFSWVYSPEDQVGVVVEGDSTFQSDHQNDAAYKRMWAFSKGTCDALHKMEANSSIVANDPEKNSRAFYMDGTMGIRTTNIDLDQCLKDNLLDPDATINAKLKVDLTVNPKNPINDPNGGGDILNINSSALNSQNANNLKYKWTVLESRSGSEAPIDTTNWIDITSLMEKSGAFLAEDATGFSKDKLDVNLNLQDSDIVKNLLNEKSYNGVFYLKVKLMITGSAADGSQSAQGETDPIRIKQQGDSIHAYTVSATSSGILSLTPLELCYNQSTGKTTDPCFVVKNEIVGVVVPNNTKSSTTPFSWTVNGNAVSCSSTMSADCAKGNILIFPILGNEGESVTVTATGTDKNNEAINVTRQFVIVGSDMQITSADGNAWKKVLGFYRTAGASGSCFQGSAGCIVDLSDKVLQTNNGSVVTLNAFGQSGFDWTVDGQTIPEYQDKPQISFPVDKVNGESYNIGISTHLTSDYKTQMNNVRLALSKNWGITPAEITDENQSASIQLDVVSDSGQSLAQAKQSGFAASLITHLPEQLMFLLKISLTGLIMFLFAGLLFAVMPSSEARE